MRIGFDIGGVLSNYKRKDKNSKEDSDISLEEIEQNIPKTGMYELVAELVKNKNQVYVISFCGDTMERKSRIWFRVHEFEEITGVGPDQWYFVRHRWDKGPVAKALGLSHFIDDNFKVLNAINETIPSTKLFAFQPMYDYDLYNPSTTTIIEAVEELRPHLGLS